ncbi:DUF3999 family protein [Ascidiimonas sp. W6]|uniref:DUF3999 family protein n=1 Tax=Ascidiimonas meishanensis TaxID=3128903 RepID=UPI0030EE893E
MKLKNNLFTCLMLLVSFTVFSQQGYQYQRELIGINEVWHSVVLPDAVFEKASSNLSDLRILGITADNDTIEAPYLLKLKKEKIVNRPIEFKRLNTSYNQNGYYYTFEIPTSQAINELKLDFTTPNFDWKVRLEGSQDQKEWFTVLEDYRIVSIKNELTNFSFTTLSFPSSAYRYFRLLVKNTTDPQLKTSVITQKEVTHGVYKGYRLAKTSVSLKKSNTTELEVELPLAVPVSYIKIPVTDAFDYYRPITIQYVSDSVQTEKGWYYNYNTLTSGTLHSIGGNEFKFPSTTLKKLKISITNQNNQPLSFGPLEAKGYQHEMVARFTTPATYFLVYGDKNASRPRYDIQQFTDKIPNALTTLNLGQEQFIERKPAKVKTPLFENEAWLWLLMAVIIAVLGWFTFKMIKKA